MREHWEYQGAWTAGYGYGRTLEGKRCYWFRRENIGTGSTTLIIPIEKYWDTTQLERKDNGI